MGNVKSTISIKIKGQVTQPYLGPGAYNSNATQNHIPSPLCLNAKDMFNSGSNSGSSSVSLLLPVRELTTTRAFSLNMLPITIFPQLLYCLLGAICRICPNVFTTVIGIKKFFENIAVMHVGPGHGVLSDKFVFHINRNMVLIAEEIFFILSCPASISIFLPRLVSNLPENAIWWLRQEPCWQHEVQGT